jgi:hypothetical protein
MRTIPLPLGHSLRPKVVKRSPLIYHLSLPWILIKVLKPCDLDLDPGPHGIRPYHIVVLDL